MIPKPQRDDNGRVQGEFYPLQKAELFEEGKSKLINNAGFVHLALRYENPFCDRPVTVVPKEFALRWQMPESSVYEAIAKLKESEAINIKSGKITIEWVNTQEPKPDHSQQDSNSENPENLRKPRKNSGNPEKILGTQKNLRKPRKNSGNSENRVPESSDSSSSSVPQTIQTYSDFIQTLSDSERANFLTFCEGKTKNLSQPVNDIEAWLAHTTKAGQNRWEVYYKKFLVKEQAQSQKSQGSTSSRHMAKKFQQEIEQQRQQAIETLRSKT